MNMIIDASAMTRHVYMRYVSLSPGWSLLFLVRYAIYKDGTSTTQVIPNMASINMVSGIFGFYYITKKSTDS